MALAFNNLRYEDILRLSENPTPEEELYNMIYGELEVLNDCIDKIAHESEDDEIFFAKLMRLRSHAVLVRDNARKRDEEYR